MTAHWQYLKSVLRHKWFVFLACLKLGVPIWSAILHDWDKFLPDEWLPYANYFYGTKGKRRKADGTYERISDEDPAFDRAWLLHQKRNKHHWQWWILPEDSGKVKLFPMPDLACREMLADWMGAGRAYVPNWTPDETRKWYLDNHHKMQLHPETRAWIQAQLGVGLPKFKTGDRVVAFLDNTSFIGEVVEVRQFNADIEPHYLFRPVGGEKPYWCFEGELSPRQA